MHIVLFKFLCRRVWFTFSVQNMFGIRSAKIANVVPYNIISIFKPGKSKDNPIRYSSIARLGIIYKLLETNI